jgi:hypothetical protein
MPNRLFPAHAVNREVGVEDLVAAVLAVGLGEHHEFDVGRVALELREGVDQVVDLVGGQRQAELGVGFFQRGLAAGQHVDELQRRALQLGEEARGFRAVEHHAFGHAVVQQAGDLLALGGAQGGFAEKAGFQRDAVFGDAFDALDGQAAVVGNVRGLGGPGRDGAETRRDDKGQASPALPSAGGQGSP